MFLVVVGFCLSWLLPLHFPPWISWHLEAVGFFVVLATAWWAWWRQVRATRSGVIKIPRVAWPLALFMGVAVTQAVTGRLLFWGDVATVGLYFALCTICMALGYASAGQPDVGKRGIAPLDALAVCILAGGACSVVVALAQTLEIWSSAWWVHQGAYIRRPGANMSQPNHLASLLVMAIASGAYLYERRKLGAVSIVALFLLLAIGMAATESRAGALAMVVLVVWWTVKQRRFQSRAPVHAGWILLIAVAVLMGVWPSFYNAFQFLEGEAGTRIAEKGVRLIVWAQLVEALLQRPWGGWGILQTGFAQNSVAHAHVGGELFSYSHNLFLDLAIWMGIPLALVFSLPALKWLYKRLRAAHQLIPWYCVAVGISLAVHSMLEFPYAYAYFLAPVFFALGALERSLAAGTIRIKAGVVAAFLAATTATAAWSAVEYLQIEEDFRVMRFEVLRLGNVPLGYTPPEVVLFTQLAALLDAGRVELKPQMSPGELELLRQVAMRYPWSATQFRYTVALALNGDAPEAIRQMQVLRQLHGERMYQGLKARIQQMAETEQPSLRGLQLP